MASSTASTLTSLMGLQLFTRLFTFVLNQALSRLASPAAFGIVAIQFELLLSTILFLSREGVRGALLRVESAGPDRASAPQSGDKTGTRNRNGSAAMNVGFIPFIVGVPLAIGTSLLYITTASKETRVQPNFYSAVLVYVLAAIMELLAEPMHNMAMSSVQTNVRVRAEGIGITAKTLTTFLILVYDANGGGGDLALLAFAFGQLMYGSLVFLVYLRRFGRAGLLTSLSKNSSGVYFDRDVLALSTTMTSQSLVKHFLTEGDKFILSWFSPLQDQGGYALAVNYGSLIARIVFQPIEETLRLYFSKTLAQVTSSSSSTSTTSSSSPNSHEPDQNPQRQPPHKNPHLPALLKSSRTLLTLLNIQLTTSLFILIFGTHYLPLFLTLLLPPRYLHTTSAPKVLEAWVWYIPFLAVNGGLEAFFASCAGREDVGRQSRWMVLFTMIYTTCAVVLYKAGFGDVSLVYANIVNLVVRIGYAWMFCRRFFSEHYSSSSSSNGGGGGGSGGGSNSELDSTEEALINLRPRTVLPPRSLVLLLAISMGLIRTSEHLLGNPTMIVRQYQGQGMGRISAILVRPVLAHLALGVGLAIGCLGWWVWILSGSGRGSDGSGGSVLLELIPQRWRRRTRRRVRTKSD